MKQPKRFLLYGHGGSYNHGAEAIVKMTIRCIRQAFDNVHIILSSHFPAQDIEFGLDADEIISPDVGLWTIEKRASVENKEGWARKMYAQALSTVTSDTLLLSVGGDNYCYDNWHRLSVFQQHAIQRKATSVLWGCSIDPDRITPKMIAVLNTHDHIIARESRTYRALSGCGIQCDIQLIPDIAFGLPFETVALPSVIQDSPYISINISPLILRRETQPGILLENLRHLIHFILSKTKMKVALIPHVVCDADNDFDALSALYASLSQNQQDRIWQVSNTLSASQYKYIIARSSALICSRTHASIAAYSSGVPCLVIGYSVKSLGIAEDLGMQEFLIGVEQINSPYELTTRFHKLNTPAFANSTVNLQAYAKKANTYLSVLKQLIKSPTTA